jgi:hypothetical protein
MADAGLVVLTAFISPHRAERQMVRERVGRIALSKCLSIRRWRFAKRATRKGCTKKRVPENCATSPELTRYTKRLNRLKFTWKVNNW